VHFLKFFYSMSNLLLCYAKAWYVSLVMLTGFYWSLLMWWRLVLRYQAHMNLAEGQKQY